ncbi:MAG: hypothetical protein ACKVK3_04930 [Acidimicrobiales bacterium]|jgi:beta-glucosidase
MCDSSTLSPTPEQVGNLTLRERAAITAGYDIWTMPSIESLGVSPLPMTDDGRPQRCQERSGVGEVRSVCVGVSAPTWTALTVSFDEKLLGREARQKRARVLLALTLNRSRSPLYDRAFETDGEISWLSGKLAAAFINGAAAQGVATTPKHLIGHEAEYR